MAKTKASLPDCGLVVVVMIGPFLKKGTGLVCLMPRFVHEYPPRHAVIAGGHCPG